DESAIVVHAGPGREDRLLTGSYRDLRLATPATPPPKPATSSDDSNPFGL
ncbi:MAG: hypothetical protein RLY70_19, partial [Planctomycetota bacterium]